MAQPGPAPFECMKCGGGVWEGQAFCASCGQPLVWDPASRPRPRHSGPGFSPDPVAATVAQIPGIVTAEPPAPAPGRPVAPTRPKRPGSPIAGLVAVVVVLLLCTWAWSAISNRPATGGTATDSNPIAFFSLNTNPPAYVKTVSALKEGSKAFQIYFILADASGTMTTADGTAILTIRDETYGAVGRVLYSQSFPIKHTDFQKTTVGQGAFAHDAILCLLGRVPYSVFSQQPSGSLGKAEITFSQTGRAPITGDDSVFFDQ